MLESQSLGSRATFDQLGPLIPSPHGQELRTKEQACEGLHITQYIYCARVGLAHEGAPTEMENAAFLCPITRTVMTDPVIDPEGNSYERSAIMDWLQRSSTSPVTRAPLTARDLAPNRALREAIEEAAAAKVGAAPAPVAAAVGPGPLEPAPEPAPEASAADVAADGSVSVTTAVSSRADGAATILASIKTPPGSRRTPTDVCCVVDVSGSMGAEATMKGQDGGLEAHGLSLLDVVKHAVTTIISVLGPDDRLSLVAYSSEARMVFDLLAMNDEGKAQAKVALAGLRTGGQTNLWDGLHSGLEVLRRGCEAGTHRLSAVLLLTDGQPNICPPRGHLQMLRRYKDQNVALSATISTFGFGYRLDSELLRELATEGDGMYAFIPDSGFVGTAFVNALSNLLVTMAKNAELSLEPLNGASLVNDGILGGVPCQDASWGTQLGVGSLQYGQSRNFIVQMQLPAGFAPGTPCLSLTLKYRTRHGPELTTCTTEALHSTDSGSPEISLQSARLALVDRLHEAAALATTKGGTGPEVQAVVTDLVTQMKATTVPMEQYKGLLADAEGQATMALSTPEFFDKWGCHYLPSLARAHQLEQCNNFKDPGVQFYGGELFCQLRDQADDLFCKLPPPKPSARPAVAYGGGSHRAAPRAAAPVDMSMYNSRSNPCFAGHCTVLMGDGTTKTVDSLARGDCVKVPNNGVAQVRCVVKTICYGGRCDLVHLPGGLVITPWHPVRLQGATCWSFPNTLAQPIKSTCAAVYSFVLDSSHVLFINGMQCVTLGHGVVSDAVASHPYFGSAQVIKDLSRMWGWSRGLVEFDEGCLFRSESTGLLSRFDPQRELGAHDNDNIVSA